jgi:arylsulfatase A-like enzyme
MKKNPNIVLITVDALRADRLGFLGYQKDISPNIDSLAEESTIFTRAFSVGPNSPHSFPSILTSTYPLDYQGLRKIEKPRIFLSEVLKEQGYVTAAFHSAPYLSDFFGYNQGWDFFEYISPSFSHGVIPNKGMLTRFKLRLKDILKRLLKRFLVSFYPELLFKIMYRSYKNRVSEKDESHIKASYLNEIIKDFVSSQVTPFFLWVHYMDVHSPYFPRENRKQGQLLSYAEFVAAWLPGYLEYADKRPFKKFIEPYFRMMLDFYDQGVRYLDKELADLFNFLKKENAYQNTIICFTADHGEEFLEHGEGFHNCKLYNELLHVPLLIKTPQGKNRQIEEKVSLIDLPSTLCELAGIAPPSSFKGKNLFNNKREIIFHQSGIGNSWVEIDKLQECKFACQSDAWKYILDYCLEREELYNLSQDPKEQNNLSQFQPEILSQMRKIIQDFKKENPPFSLLKYEK